MKNSVKGFMLIETLVVSMFILGTLIFLYAQFRTIKKSYEKSFTYNTVEGLYAVKNVEQYLSNEGIYNLSYKLAFSGERFISFYDSDSNISGKCDESVISEIEYCNSLMNNLNIKSVIFTKENLNKLNANINKWQENKEQPKELNNKMIDFIKSIKYQGFQTYYRLIVEFKDETFATLVTKGTNKDTFLIPETIELKGGEVVGKVINKSYEEPGYIIKYTNGLYVDGTDEQNVVVSGTVGNVLDQEYVLTYNLTYDNSTISSITRTVKVLPEAYNFEYTGNYQTFTVPANGKYKIELWGAQGGSADSYSGGKGGYVSGDINLKIDDLLYFVVGGQGSSLNGNCTKIINGNSYNGGGQVSCQANQYYGAGGGGATHVAKKEGLLSTLNDYRNDILLVAAGGGGASSDNVNNSTTKGYGGYGGGEIGGIGTISSSSERAYGYGGTQTAGGETSSGYTKSPEVSATFGIGCSAKASYSGYLNVSGGAGYYGGGCGVHGGGGGGSSYISLTIFAKMNIAGNEVMPSHDGTSTMTGNTGNGYAKITYIGGIDNE